MNPYIGVTGFFKREEVAAALGSFPASHSRKLMVGVLATWKSLRGIPMKPKWAKQTPNPELIGSVFPDDKRAVNLVHLSAEDGQESWLLHDMIKVHGLAGANFHGFQLNVAWPEVRSLDEYRTIFETWPRVVLQIGARAVESAGGTPDAVADMLYHYAGVVDDILLDPSGGRGQPFDTERARGFLRAVADRSWSIGLGVAGGLGPDSLHLLEPLIGEFPDLNIDAQGRLRNEENELDISAMSDYIAKAARLVS